MLTVYTIWPFLDKLKSIDIFILKHEQEREEMVMLVKRTFGSTLEIGRNSEELIKRHFCERLLRANFTQGVAVAVSTVPRIYILIICLIGKTWLSKALHSYS